MKNCLGTLRLFQVLLPSDGNEYVLRAKLTPGSQQTVRTYSGTLRSPVFSFLCFIYEVQEGYAPLRQRR